MLALRLFGKGDVRLVEVEKPAAGPGEIVLKVGAAAICGTDIRMWQSGKSGVDENHPLTLGHEFAGTVVEVGPGVPSKYEIGMRLGMQPNIGCGICDMCVSGRQHLCPDYRAFGINMDGAMAEFVKIPADAILRGNLIPLGDGVSFEEAAVAEPLSCAYNGFTKCFVKPGDWALVVGAGPIGAMHAQLLNMAGARVIVNDLSEERLDMLKALFPYIETVPGDPAQYVMQKTGGRGLDVAIVACPVPAVQAAMLPLMNYGGRVNFFGGVPEDRQPVPINTNLVHYKELYLTGSTRSSIAQMRKVVEFAGQGLLDVKGVITHRYPLADALQALENAKNAVGIKHVLAMD